MKKNGICLIMSSPVIRGLIMQINTGSKKTFPLGQSNEFAGDFAEVSVAEGTLMIVKSDTSVLNQCVRECDYWDDRFSDLG
ncbi:MAG TPA: hypothetical protein DIS78_06360 [Lachnospiraceae bacterium]|nr:hypothetical protein [Lachnospiraceae bacterium]